MQDFMLPMPVNRWKQWSYEDMLKFQALMIKNQAVKVKKAGTKNRVWHGNCNRIIKLMYIARTMPRINTFEILNKPIKSIAYDK